MKRWTVIITSNKPKADYVYGNDYFPRDYHYKKAADHTVKTLAQQGVGAYVKKA